MKYSKEYQRTRDIDWFFRKGNRCYHVASNGGLLPDFVNDVLRLREEQANVSSLDNIYESIDDVNLNHQYVNERIKRIIEQYRIYNNEQEIPSIEEMKKAYLKSFIEMAKKGFYSYDRALEGDSKYVLICGPQEPILKIEGLQLLEASNEIYVNQDGRSFYVL